MAQQPATESAPPRPGAKVPSVVILCEGRGPTLEMLQLAQALKEDGRLSPVLLFRDSATHESVPKGALLGYEVVTTYQEALPAPRASLVTRALNRLVGLPLGRRATVIYRKHVDRLNLSERWAEEVFRRYDPAAVVVHNDRSIGFGPGFCKVASLTGRFSIAVPFAISDPEADTSTRARDPLYQAGTSPFRVLKATVRVLAPAQFYRGKVGQQLLFLDPPLLMALWRKRMLLPRPWTFGGGRTDKVAVDGEADRRAMIAAGVPADKILVTGQVSSDVLWRHSQQRQEIKDALGRRYGLSPGCPLIICSLPVAGEHHQVPWDHHLTMVDALLDALAGVDCDVLLSLHPRQRRSDYDARAAARRLPILVEPLRETLPAADIFVGYSSTIRWALMLRIPCVTLELFDLGYELFGGLAGMEVARMPAQVGPALDRLIKEIQSPGEFTRRLQDTATDVACCDGKTCSRIVAAILLGTEAKKAKFTEAKRARSAGGIKPAQIRREAGRTRVQ